MPELPEVETVRRTLEPRLAGRKISGVEILTPKIIKQPGTAEFASGLTGRTVLGVDRRGKYLLLHLSGGMTLVTHLRMTGQLTCCSPERERDKHTHVIIFLDNGWELRFADLRKFGEMHLLPTGNYGSISGLANLGPEPLGEEFVPNEFTAGLKGKKTKIKALLLDQSFLAGLGNIYVDEALYRAGVHPERPAGSLTVREAGTLYETVREVLAEGIKYRGTSVKDYVDGDGKAGSFQDRLKAYGRAGEPCFRCGQPMEKVKVGGRTSVFCPQCQRKDEAPN